ncbi:hypothetical protein OKW35_008081 [Paraburkholderia sp. MM5477-R1]
MDLVASHLGPDRRTVQLHLGDGTPTFFPVAELEELVQQLQNRFAFSIAAELAIEIDPRTVGTKTLSPLARLGFNRASFGVQDFATTFSRLSIASSHSMWWNAHSAAHCVSAPHPAALFVLDRHQSQSWPVVGP